MTPEERALYFGYLGQSVREATGSAVCAGNTMHCSSALFSALLHDELTTWPQDALVFSNDFQDAGPAISTSDGDIAAFSLFASRVATERYLQSPRIYGVIFLDADNNNAYSPGEELAGETIEVYDGNQNLVTTLVSDNAGHFSMTLGAGQQYLFKVALEGVVVSETVFVDTDKFVKLYKPASS